jgi:putative Holliday junction resolvase
VAVRIAERAKLPVTLWDERMTTARALEAVRALGGRLKGRKQDVDQLAATTLLQSYLDSRR